MSTRPSRRWLEGALITWLLVAMLLGIFRLATGAAPLLAWPGGLLAAAAPLCWFGLKRFVVRPPHPLGFTVLSCLGVCISMVTAWRYGKDAEPALIVAGTSLIAWFFYLRRSRNNDAGPAGSGNASA